MPRLLVDAEGTHSRTHSLSALTLLTLQEYVEDMLSTRESFTSPAAGTWPADHAASLARLALSCSMARRRDRPNLAEEVLVRLRPCPPPPRPYLRV